MTKTYEIVIVGGGAAGLELVAHLNKLAKKNNNIKITLIDNQLKHVWKPLLHKVAAGSLSSCESTIDYFIYAHQKNFEFYLGSLKYLNQKKQVIGLEAYFDDEGQLLIPEREIKYDILVISIGSQTNDFNIPGVMQNCLLIDNLAQAEFFNKKIVTRIVSVLQPVATKNEKIKIIIVGGGATGLELAAELNYTLSTVLKFNPQVSSSLYEICIIEASDRLLSALPSRISRSVTHYLQSNDIKIILNTKIIKVNANYLETSNGLIIHANIIAWAAGVKGGATLANLDGLEKNHLNQLIVNEKLQTTKDEKIFALGDCASCPQVKNGKKYFVPPRAQAAHQQAKLLFKSLQNYINGKPLSTYNYHDYGALINLSQNTTFGYLMNRVAKNIYIEGWLAQFFYWLLYQKHLAILKGYKFVLLKAIGSFFISKSRQQIKLH